MEDNFIKLKHKKDNNSSRIVFPFMIEYIVADQCSYWKKIENQDEILLCIYN